MKYISLIGLMGMYGRFIKEYHNVVNLSHQMYNIPFQANEVYRPFNIHTYMNDETGQVMNRIMPNRINLETTQMTEMNVPPILEIEWLKDKLKFDEETVEALTQISYMTMVWQLWWIRTSRPAEWVDFLEEQENVIVEVEDINDTAHITSIFTLDEISLPKIRSWATIMVYGRNFPSVYRQCLAQSVSIKEIHYHLPIMLALFMRDYEAKKLSNWSKSTRLAIENEIQKEMEHLLSYRAIVDKGHTYGITSGLTGTDVELMKKILRLINTKLHDLNSNIGLISYTEYTHVRGPETIRASVRLTDMRINWQNEMARAAREKKEQKESENGNNDDGGYDDEY